METPIQNLPDRLTFEIALGDERERLIRLCARLTGNAAVAEDLAQDTLVEAWRLRARLYDPTGYAPWLFAVARNVCLRWSRRQAIDLSRRVGIRDDETFDAPLAARSPQNGGDVEIALERSELADLLDRALALLPPDTRDVLIQRYVEESAHAEIAARLGLSEGAVRVRLHRGKLALQRILAVDLRDDAAAFGLAVDTHTGWQATRVWCPICGQSRVRGLIDRAKRSFMIECPSCRSATVDMAAAYLDGVQGYWRTLLWSYRAAHDYFRSALATGSAPCDNCGRPMLLRHGLPPYVRAETSPRHGVHLVCVCCGIVSFQPAVGLAMSSPDFIRFWRTHRRVRALPVTTVETNGAEAIVTQFHSVGTAAQIDVVARSDNFDVISIHTNVPDLGKEAV